MTEAGSFSTFQTRSPTCGAQGSAGWAGLVRTDSSALTPPSLVTRTPLPSRRVRGAHFISCFRGTKEVRVPLPHWLRLKSLPSKAADTPQWHPWVARLHPLHPPASDPVSPRAGRRSLSDSHE